MTSYEYEVLFMFVTTVIKCHSLSYMTLFEMSLLTPWHKPIHHNLSVSLSWQLDIIKTTQPELIIKLKKAPSFIG